ncbi:MAG: SDR family oxidoreductase [Candidatus Aenigmarchaeota archaeon]|nr:SDR family oxidoreductase [Candidatus Aenigmarchaeota archaeon]
MSKNMNILVTGGLGHIGSKLIVELSKRKDVSKIVILDNLHTQRYCSLMNLPDNVKYRFIEGDVINENDLKNAIRNVDIIIHLAAITNAPETMKFPELTKKVNYDSVKMMLEIAKKEGVKKFFFPSTTSVYGHAQGMIDESYTKCKPLTPYAEYKLKAEQEVIKANGNMKTCVARFGTVYGYSIGMRFHTAVNKFIFQAINKQPITVWEDALNQKRPYLDLEDSIRFIQFFMDNNDDDFFGRVYNVLTENTTVRNVINIIKKSAKDTEIKMTKNPILNQQSYEIGRSEIEKMGFTFKGNMDNGISETIKAFSSFI